MTLQRMGLVFAGRWEGGGGRRSRRSSCGHGITLECVVTAFEMEEDEEQEEEEEDRTIACH